MQAQELRRRVLGLLALRLPDPLLPRPRRAGAAEGRLHTVHPRSRAPGVEPGSRLRRVGPNESSRGQRKVTMLRPPFPRPRPGAFA